MRFAEPSPIWSRLKEFHGRLEKSWQSTTGQLWTRIKDVAREAARDELSPIVRGARKSSLPNRTRAGGSGRDDGVGARHGRDADKVSNDWVARAGRTTTDVAFHGRSSVCTCHAKPRRSCGSWQVWRWQIGSCCSVSIRHSRHARAPHPCRAAPGRRASSGPRPSRQ
jgi:hypothetical protein